VVERYEYDVYGTCHIQAPDFSSRTASLYGNAYTFTGRELDALDNNTLNLMYYRARIYDPETGRFMQSDPLEYIDGMSLYEYAVNNPVFHLDSLGLTVQTGDPVVVRSEISDLLAILRKGAFAPGAFEPKGDRLVLLNRFEIMIFWPSKECCRNGGSGIKYGVMAVHQYDPVVTFRLTYTELYVDYTKTAFTENQRRYLESLLANANSFIKEHEESHKRLAESIFVPYFTFGFHSSCDLHKAYILAHSEARKNGQRVFNNKKDEYNKRSHLQDVNDYGTPLKEALGPLLKYYVNPN